MNASGSAPASTADPVRRLLQSAAAYFESEDAARQVVDALRVEHQVPAAKTTLLGPDDAGAFRFAWRARHWSGRQTADGGMGHGAAAFIGAMLGGMLAAMWLVVDLSQDSTGSTQGRGAVLALLCALPAGACIAMLGLSLFRAVFPARHFRNHVLRQLRAGRWAVVVDRVPAQHQTAVLARMQRGSTAWTASALPRHPL